MAPKVLLLENIHASAKEMFEQAGFVVHTESTSYSEADLLQKLPEYSVVGIRSKTNLTQKILKNATSLQVIGCYCIGTNQVDLETSALQGVPVFNAPHSNTRSVAELVIAEIIALSRGLCDLSHQVHTGVWNKSAKGSREVRGKTLGIIGYGHIGSQVSVLAEAMGLDVCFFDVIKKLPLGNAKAMSSLDSLLERSDFITLHVPETPETKNMIGAREFAKMKNGVHFINASRGTVVVIEDLAQAMKNKKVAGAAVDVFPQEPKDNNERFMSQLQGMSNVILTPHVGGSTEEAQAAIGSEVTYSLLSFMQQGKTYGAVQFPSMEVPLLRSGVSRLVNAHKNVPGVLGEVNSIVSQFGVNIQAQYLATNSQVGYLVMDLEDTKQSSLVAQKIGSLKTSLKTRLI